MRNLRSRCGADTRSLLERASICGVESHPFPGKQFPVDRIAHEGVPVKAASAGVVLLAENGWNEADPFSTSSHAGGNTAIMFDPATDRFYRYCHMETVYMIPGKVVEPGDVIGRVGHSGLNASRPRHGGHLHFEVNRWNGGEIHPFTAREIWDLLRKAP